MNGIKVEGHWRFEYEDGTVIERKNLITQSGLNFLAALLAGEYVGDNLIPPFAEWDRIHGNATILSPYKLQHTKTGSSAESSTLYLTSTPNTTYSFNTGGSYMLFYQSADKVNWSVTQEATGIGSFTTNSTSNYLAVETFLVDNAIGTFTWENPILNIGPFAFPFQPAGKQSVNNFPYYLAIGSGSTPAANADIKLKTETFRKLVSSVTRQANTVRLRTFLLQSEANDDHQEFGIYLAGTEEKDMGILLNRLVTPISKTDNTVLTVEVRITFNAG